MKLAIGTWKETFKILTANPAIFLPFFIVGLVDAGLLTLIFLAPQFPFSLLLAPPIRAFWGEAFLHYPQNFLLIPRLFSLAHIASGAIIGLLMTGLAIGMLNEAKQGKKPQILLNLVSSLKRYFILFGIWLILFILSGLVYRIPNLFLSPTNRIAFQAAIYLSFLFVILIEVFFIYAFPAAIVEKKGLIKALKSGFILSRSNFLATLILLLIPSLLYFPIMALKGNQSALMNRFFPEIVLIVLGLGIVVTVLVDYLVTSSITILFLNKRQAP